MLPPKFLDFVKTLTARTEQGEFSWSYDDNNSLVKLKEKAFFAFITLQLQLR